MEPADPNALTHLASLDAQLTALLPGIRERRVLLEIAALGFRRADVVDQLEALGADPTMPSGDGLALVRGPATRELALLVRAQLGVGPAQAARVLSLAAEIADPLVRDVVLAHVPGPETDALALRLVEHVRELPHEIEWLPFEILLRASSALAARRATTPRGRRSPHDLTRRVSRHPPRATHEAFAIAYALLPGFGTEVTGERWRNARKPPIASLANVAPRIAPRAPVPASAFERAPEPAGYRALRAGGPTLTRAVADPIAYWALEGRLDALDGLADADSLSDDAIAFLEQLVQGRIARALDRDGTLDSTFEAALDALCTHAPDRWLAYVETLAEGGSPFARRAAAQLLSRTPRLGLPGVALLDALELDPTHLVRRAARDARAAWARRHDARLWARRIAWVALRDDDAASLVFSALTEAGTIPELPGTDRRRLRRLLGRIVLSDTARERVAFSFHGRTWSEGVPVAPRANAQLTTTDGRRLRVAVTMATGDRPTEEVATVVKSGDLRAALPSEVERFLWSAPSTYMRLTGPEGSDIAVRARMRDGNLVLLPADPRLLERIR